VKKDPKRVQTYLQKKLLRLRRPPDTDQVLRDPVYKAQMIELLCRTKYEKSGYNVVEVIQRDDKYAYSEFFNKAAQVQIKNMEDRVVEMILKTDLMQPDIDTSTPTSTKLSIKHSKQLSERRSGSGSQRGAASSAAPSMATRRNLQNSKSLAAMTRASSNNDFIK